MVFGSLHAKCLPGCDQLQGLTNALEGCAACSHGKMSCWKAFCFLTTSAMSSTLSAHQMLAPQHSSIMLLLVSDQAVLIGGSAAEAVRAEVGGRLKGHIDRRQTAVALQGLGQCCDH